MDYRDILSERFGFDDELLQVYEKTKNFRSSAKDKLINKLIAIERSYGLSAALLLLYRQQVESGFVLADPADTSNKEIIYPVRLSGEEFFLGANFAYLANNHFTLFNKEHRPQLYRKEIIAFLLDFLDKTNGCFRGIFNGLAGASIEHHEHMQVTTEKFPVEDIKVSPKMVILNNDKIKIYQLFYYTSLLLLESAISGEIVKYADAFLTRWHTLNPEYHTENIVAVKHHGYYRLFIFPRDKRKLAGAGKTGAMASFEASGGIVLSDIATERTTFDNISPTSIQNMLAGIKPAINLKQLFPQDSL